MKFKQTAIKSIWHLKINHNAVRFTEHISYLCFWKRLYKVNKMHRKYQLQEVMELFLGHLEFNNYLIMNG